MMQLLRQHVLQVELALRMRRSPRFLEAPNQTKIWLIRVPGLLELTLLRLQTIIVLEIYGLGNKQRLQHSSHIAHRANVEGR